MAIDIAALRPGMVIVTATADKAGWWIRLRSKMQRRNALHNHCAIVTHRDDTGRWRAVEGRPGGFGWANVETYCAHADTVVNVGQPLTDAQRQQVAVRAVEMVGIPYDWSAIIGFAATTAGLRFVPAEWPDDGVPSHVVCSSAADYLYESVAADNPGGYTQTRGTDPSAWASFILDRGWHQPS